MSWEGRKAGRQDSAGEGSSWVQPGVCWYCVVLCWYCVGYYLPLLVSFKLANPTLCGGRHTLLLPLAKLGFQLTYLILFLGCQLGGEADGFAFRVEGVTTLQRQQSSEEGYNNWAVRAAVASSSAIFSRATDSSSAAAWQSGDPALDGGWREGAAQGVTLRWTARR